MNNFLLLCGLVMLGNTATTESATTDPTCKIQKQQKVATLSCTLQPVGEVELAGAIQPWSLDTWTWEAAAERLDLNSIIFIGDEEDAFNLGFNTADYLPDSFNPHEVYVNLKDFVFIEEEEELNFDTTKYLPENFDPYAVPKDFNSISYMEEEGEDLEPYFDTAAYLPKDFDPYAKVSVKAVVDVNDPESDYRDTTYDGIPVSLNLNDY